MIRPGNVLVHPTFGTRLTFLHTGAETGGRLLEWETLYQAYRAQESGNTPHFHVTFIEQYDVLDGTAGYELKGAEQRARAGEHVEIPLGAPHRNLWNASADDLRIRTRLEMNPPNLPALQYIEDFFETLYGLARDGKVNADGLPKSFLHTALLVQGFQPETGVAGIPIPVQRVLFGVLGTLARARGYRTQYPQYDTATPETISHAAWADGVCVELVDDHGRCAACLPVPTDRLPRDGRPGTYLRCAKRLLTLNWRRLRSRGGVSAESAASARCQRVANPRWAAWA